MPHSAHRTTGFALSVVLALVPLLPSPAAARAPAHAGAIALTFDDLPGLSITPDQTYVEQSSAAILAGLKRHHLPATGFVNEDKLDFLIRARQIAILRAWLDAGMDLGNHTFSHVSPNDIGADAYIADIARGEPVTKALLAEHDKTMRWFRHPYLETGSPAAERIKIDGWLAAHGYRVAPVTVDASDWEFAEPYDDAIAHHDEARRQHIRAQYLAYTDRMLGWSQRAARALFGREIAFVMLLHATRLNGDSIDDLAALLARHRLRGITLDQAMRDPAYRTPDDYAGKDGDDWLDRWSQTLHKNLPWASYSDPPADIGAAYNAIDPDHAAPVPAEAKPAAPAR